MSDWGVLGLDGDPTPGDPDAVRDMAVRLRQQAALAENNTARLRAVAAGGGELRMDGDYAASFTEALTELPDELAKLARAYRGCGDALHTYAGSLAEAKTQSGVALRDGADAHGRYQGALREVYALLPADRHVRLWPREEMSEPSIGTATADLETPGLREQIQTAARRGQAADADRARAAAVARQAAGLRDGAARTCADGIGKALDDSGIKNKSWFRKAFDAVSAPFRSWDAFVGLCRNVAMVAGVVALFVSGPIGLALVAVAVVAGAAVLADTLSKYARGQASLGQLALDGLGVLPGGRGVVSLARLGRGAKLVGAALRGGGTALAARGRNMMSLAGSAMSKMREKAVEAAKRILRQDPVDVASGDVVLTQTDVELPGLLPLTLSRTHISSYRLGTWFGRSWTSTLDQRIEVDDDGGVCFATADGMVLVYPAAAADAGGLVLPVEGPRWPLTRDADGAYTISDPGRGWTWRFATPATSNGSRPWGDPVQWPLAALTDRNGHRIDVVYDGDGAPVEVVHSGGYRIGVQTEEHRVVGLMLLGSGRGSAESAGSGGTATETELARFGYDEAGDLTEVVNSSGQPLRFGYDGDGRMVMWADRNGTEYRYTYDGAGRCVATDGSGGFMTGRLRYDTDQRIITVVDSFGHATVYRINDAVQVEALTDPLGHTTVYAWDRYDRKLAETDPLGRTTRYAYDADGNLAELVRPDGNRVSVDWNGLRLPVAVVAPDGARWEREYDDRGNLTAVTDPAGAQTTFAYDDRGRLTTMTDALGNVRRIETDDAGLPVAVVDPLGAVTAYRRDAFGRVVAVTDPLGGVTQYGWTVEGKLTSRTTPDGAVERWTYDGEGNLVEHVDAAGLVTRTEATHFDLPSARTTPDGARLEFAYDTELRLAAVTNPQGLVWRYDYDPAGNLVRETDFNGRILAYAYDAAGQLVERTNGVGETIRFARNPLGDVVEKRGPDGVTTFAYDAAGRVVRAANPDADCVFRRDALGRVTEETCNGRTVASAYDALGRRVRRVTPSGADSRWDYDENDLPVALHTAGRTLRFAHDAAGRQVERSLDTGVVLAQGWDASHRLLSQTVTAGGPGTARQARLVQRRDYTYSPDGYVTEIDDMLAGLRRYDLDPARRVTAVRSGSGREERYAYDAAGNITDASWPTRAQPDGLDASAQGGREYAGTLIRRAGNVRYEHDAQGRMILRQQKRLSAKPRTWRYDWDSDDRITGVTTPDRTRWRYLYDPFARRIAKQRLADDGTVAEQIDFAWDGTVLAEQTHTVGGVPAGQVTVWEWEPDSFRPLTQSERRPLACSTSRYADGAESPDGGHLNGRTRLGDGVGSDGADQAWYDARFHAIVTDLVGTPTELVDPGGDLAWHARTTLWGNRLLPADGDVDCPLRFPGQYHDAETALNYNYHRHYDPTTARYNANDPLGLAPAPNPHVYVLNPLSWLDPLGLAPYPSASTNGVNVARQVPVTNVDHVIAETAAGRGNLTSKFTLTADEALDAGQRWLGSNYSELGKAGSGVFRSADGLRQFRMDASSISGQHAPGVPHVHLELFGVAGSKRPIVNNHIPFIG
jgi:RHS repeat-associated protein